VHTCTIKARNPYLNDALCYSGNVLRFALAGRCTGLLAHANLLSQTHLVVPSVSLLAWTQLVLHKTPSLLA